MKRYEKYKPSGVDWIGEIPENWKCKRLGTWFTDRREKVSDKDYEPLSVTKNGIVPQLESAAKSNDGDNRKLVKSGDFVINSRSDRKGSSGLSYLDGSVSLINIVLKPRNINGAFSEYLLKSRGFIEEFYRNGHGIVADLWTTRFQEMKFINISIPSPTEQQAIVEFLDDKTAKIDQTISLKQKEINLLKERRQILIQKAVTKGLNDQVKMKDSGVDWIGEIPEHWELERFKFLCKITTGSKNTENKVEDGLYPFYVRSQKPEKINTYTFDGEAILTAGDGAGVGKVFHYINEKFDFHQRVYKFSHFTKIKGKLLYYYLKNNFFNVALNGEAKSTVDSLRLPLISNFIVTIPPPIEQTLIIEFIENASKKIDKAISIKQQEIEKLKEYKTVLIDNVVTGKVKVN